MTRRTTPPSRAALPSEGAAVTRRTIPAIEVVPATADRWPDVMAVMGGSGGDRGCWCQYYRWPSSEFSALGAGGGRRALERQVTEGPPPGLLAYVDGQPVGWVGIGPRHEMGRLVRSRTIPLIDDVPVWSILCFLVRPGFRRRGVTKALLQGVIAHARAAGAPGTRGLSDRRGRSVAWT